jgi:hypothetical protein
MEKNKFLEELNFINEAEYKIIVQGELGQEWTDRLSNMHIVVDKANPKKIQSLLTGKISDQAALSGVLNTLYDLRMTVISVNLIADKNDELGS